MKAVVLCAFLLSPLLLPAAGPDNRLTPQEKASGWSLLFDGQATGQWRQAYGIGFPARGWVVRGGELRGEFTKGMESGDGGDIVTREVYRNFEMSFDWKLGPGGNSGVKYFVEERKPQPPGSQPGYEYQIIDDAHYIYQDKKLPQVLKTASIYDVVAADKPDVEMDVWHRSRIRVRREQTSANPQNSQGRFAARRRTCSSICRRSCPATIVPRIDRASAAARAYAIGAFMTRYGSLSRRGM